MYLENSRGGGFSGTHCITLTSSKYGYNTGQFLHGVCTVRAAEPVWRDGGVAGEAEEGGALGGTRLVDGGALVEIEEKEPTTTGQSEKMLSPASTRLGVGGGVYGKA